MPTEDTDEYREEGISLNELINDHRTESYLSRPGLVSKKPCISQAILTATAILLCHEIKSLGCIGPLLKSPMTCGVNNLTLMVTIRY